MTTVVGDLRLSLSTGGEDFQPLGSADPGAEKTKEGEVVYRDDVRVLTRAWNHRDCEPTKISNDSSEFAIFVEDTRGTVEGEEQVRSAVENLKQLYQSVFANFSGHTAVWSFDEGKLEAQSEW